MKKRLVALVIALLASHAMVSCDSRHVVDRPDTTRPAVVSTTPVDNATGVVVTAAVTVTFSEAMDASSINDVSFSVTSATTGTIAGTVTYDAVSNVATFTPSSAMTHDAAYTANIAADAKDLAGNSLASAFNWSFTTIPAPGALDRAFGTGGLVRTAVGNGNDVGAAVALQPDGKIVVAGYSTVVTAITSSISSIAISFTLARYNPNGSLDTSFGLPLNTGGKVTDFSGEARSVAIQPDGKILAAGTNGTGADFLIVRYNSDGQIDTGFGTSGQAVIDMGGNFDVVNALALQGDGKIVIAGDNPVTAPSLTANNSSIARLNADGTRDDIFNVTGIINLPYDNSWIKAVKIQTDDKILVAGYFQNTGGLLTPFISRYDQFGAIDGGFNGTGTVTASPGRDADLQGLEVLPDGKILAAGTTTNAANNTSDIFLMRFNADGTPDTSFGPDGTGSVFTDFNAGDEAAIAVSVDSGGKILVAATYRKTSGQPLTTDFAVFRYNADGVLDLTFGNGFGMVHPDFGGNLDDIAHAMQIQTDGKIVVVGSAWNGSSFDIGLARYWP